MKYNRITFTVSLFVFFFQGYGQQSKGLHIWYDKYLKEDSIFYNLYINNSYKEIAWIPVSFNFGTVDTTLNIIGIDTTGVNNVNYSLLAVMNGNYIITEVPVAKAIFVIPNQTTILKFCIIRKLPQPDKLLIQYAFLPRFCYNKILRKTGKTFWYKRVVWYSKQIEL